MSLAYQKHIDARGTFGNQVKLDIQESAPYHTDTNQGHTRKNPLHAHFATAA